MEFRAEKFNPEQHLAKLADWWVAQDFPPLPAEMLPKTGAVIIGADSAEYCAGFLFLTDSKWAWLEFIVGNPDLDKEIRRDAVRFLVKYLLGKAKEAGAAVVFSSLDAEKRPGLLAAYQDTGFVPTEIATQGVWRLDECQR